MIDIEKVIKEAKEVLANGGVILYPTDTVWGLGCDATNPVAVEKIYSIKKRADSKALVLLASSLEMVARYVKDIPEMAAQLVEVNDSPMTIVYPEGICAKPAREGGEVVVDRHFLARNVVAEDGSVAIRVPMNEFCRNLAFKLGRPVVSTSANISGMPAPKKFRDIPEEIVSAVDYVVPAPLEKESTGQPSQIIRVELDGQVKIIRA